MAASLGQALLGMPLPYGIPHTGVVIDGFEHFFGGGIQRERPAQVTRNTGLTPIARLPLGRTQRSDAEIAAHLSTLSAKYSASTYDLFANNCNHFSHDLAKFLLGGTGIPEDIVRLPERVRASGPMGAQISQMWGTMSQQFGAASGGGARADPFAAAFGAGAGAGSSGAAAGARPAPTPPLNARLPSASRLAAPPAPCAYADASGAGLVHARLQAVAAASAGALALSAEEGELLSGLGAALAAPPAPPAPWAPLACALAARALRAPWPPATASFPAALRARLLSLRADCAAGLLQDGAGGGGAGGGGLGGAAGALLSGLTAAPEGWGLASTNNQALQALVNVCGCSAGRAWATAHPQAAPALAALVARELRNAARADCRTIALGLGTNLALAWGEVGRAQGEAEASAHLQRGGLALLCALLGGLEEEGGAEAVGRRLHAAAHLLRAHAFEGGDAGALALSMDCAAGLQAVAGEAAGKWPAEVRAEAQAVLRMLQGGTL